MKLALLCLPLAMAYVPDEALVVDATYYVGPYDSETPRCEVAKFENASSASLQHHFGAGGGGGGWGWTGLLLLLNPKDGELDLTQPTKLTLDVLRFASGVLHVEALRSAPPDSLSISSTGTMHRTREQIYCPPDLCVPPKPSASVDGVSASWCGWSEWDSTAISPTLVEHEGIVEVDRCFGAVHERGCLDAQGLGGTHLRRRVPAGSVLHVGRATRGRVFRVVELLTREVWLLGRLLGLRVFQCADFRARNPLSARRGRRTSSAGGRGAG